MKRVELKEFYTDGFGWICRACERELKKANGEETTARLLSEGEAESKNPALSNLALAKWTDAERRILICPRCGVTESAGEV
jgi:hypothetical protein